MAARFGDVDTLQKLLLEAVSADANFMTSSTVGLALKRATQAGQVNVLQCLLDAGADINTKFKGASALHEAIKVNNLQVLKFLLNVKGLQCDTLSLAQKTPMMEAACRGNVKCLAALLKSGCGPHTRNNRGLSAIHYCLLPITGTVNTEDMTTCLHLLYQAGVDIDVRDIYGSTALHIAIATENLEAVVWLLQHNCRMDVDAQPPDLAPGIFSCLEGKVSLTPLLLALHFSNRRVVQLLIACGCDYYGLGWVLPYCRQYELLHDYLKRELSAPSTLQKSCRSVIRRSLRSDLEQKVQHLACLPQSVRRYLLLTDELQSF